MKKILIIILLFISVLTFCQEKFNNEKEIENIQNYKVEEISKIIDNNITISGTLLTPKFKFDNVIVIISGTGKISQKAHNYLTEYMLKNNIGVFRFDKRGVGKSTGEYNDQAKVYTNDFLEIFSELKKSQTLENKKIGFLGHSLGGIVSLKVIEKQILPNFLIQWSAPIGKPRDLLKYQINNGIRNYDNLIIGKTANDKIKTLDYIFDLIDKNPNKTAWEIWKTAKKESKKHGINKKSFSNYLMPHKLEEARIDNTKTLENINFPTLVIIGKEDILVNPKQSKTKLDEIGNSNIEFKEMDKLNHFMTKKGTNERTNEIYNVNLNFKEYLVNWINNLKK
ncbi:alpha/beta fold hydrolase [Polaribacter sp. KT25b]|uniref:alpha/beta fold hydrolase n=1 Tax=Polaribacter sp. KT25b TaxID=1855336 RepID=UPI0012FDC347|nr:alpha/beta fold hydrolase [Polaribacter sp. KT25b]